MLYDIITYTICDGDMYFQPIEKYYREIILLRLLFFYLILDDILGK